MSKNRCKNCQKEIPKNRKFCSLSCSSSYNNKKRILSKETKEKISKSHKLLYKSGYKQKNSYNIELIKKEIESENFKLLSKEYNNNKQKLKIECLSCNYIFEKRYDMWKKGQRCPKCSGKMKKTYKEVKNFIESFNYKLLSKEYKNALEKLKLKCPQGHIIEMKFNNFQQGQRCKYCQGKKRDVNYVKNFVEYYNYELLSDIYNHDEKIKLKCPKGHIYEVLFHSFVSGFRCPVCRYQNKSSQPEKEIQEYIEQIYKGKILKNDRSIIINPYTDYNMELDIYLPELNKAIEFNGIYWHSLEKIKLNDQIKKNECENMSIDLMVMNEKDWQNSKKNCLDKIRSFIYED